MVALPSIRHPSRDRSALSDSELTALARNGDEAAVRALIRRHNRRLFRVARGVVRDDSEAEDVVQETYVRAFTHLDGFRGEAGFSTWLTRIALNAALGRVRRRRPTVDLTEVENARPVEGGRVIMFPLSPGPASPESSAGREQVRRALEGAIDRLPGSFRTVFVLRDVEGLSMEETARVLSMKPETVKTRLFRARRLMRAEIEKVLAPTFSEVFPFAGQRCADMAERVLERLPGHGGRAADDPALADGKTERNG